MNDYYTLEQAQAEVERLKPIERSDMARVEAARHALAQAEAIHALSMSMLSRAHDCVKLVRRRDELMEGKR
jgi:hypothetical protein